MAGPPKSFVTSFGSTDTKELSPLKGIFQVKDPSLRNLNHMLLNIEDAIYSCVLTVSLKVITTGDVNSSCLKQYSSQYYLGNQNPPPQKFDDSKEVNRHTGLF